MKDIWIVRVETIALTDKSPDNGQLGFINCVCSARDHEDAVMRVRACLNDYGWQLLDVEDVSAVDLNRAYGDDITELIDDVTFNPNHIRLSTLHTYKPE